MVLPSRTRLGKRKQEIKEVRRENQTTTSKKHDMRCIPKKSETDEQTLKEKIDILEEENKRNTALIVELKEQIVLLKVENNSKKSTLSVESQTQWEFQEYPCNECVYLASCVDELNWHLENEHDQDGEDEPDEPSGPFTCYICRKKNRTKGELMHHRKTHHPEMVRTCTFFMQGNVISWTNAGTIILYVTKALVHQLSKNTSVGYVAKNSEQTLIS
jgi:hypothetical protein